MNILLALSLTVNSVLCGCLANWHGESPGICVWGCIVFGIIAIICFGCSVEDELSRG